MKDFSTNLRYELSELREELVSFESGNKSAGQRARKLTLKLEKLFKEFRKRSVNETPPKV